MSVFVQEVLGLLRRNFVKTTLNPTDDYFQFVRKGTPRNQSRSRASGFAPQGQALSISAGSWLCSQTGPKGLGRFVSTVKESGEVAGVIPMFWLKQGQCSWHSLKDSLLSQDTADPVIYVGNNTANANLIVSNKVFIPKLGPQAPATRGKVVFSDENGELKTNETFTFTESAGSNVFAVDGPVTDITFGTVTSGASSPPTITRINNKLILSGPVFDAASGGGGTGLPTIGQVLIAREDPNVPGQSDGRVLWGDASTPPLKFGEIIIGYENPQPVAGSIVPAVASFSTPLGTGNNNEVLTSGGPTGFPSWAPNPGISGSGTNLRVAMFTPDSNTISNSLMIQDGDAFTPATTVTNDGKWINTGTMKLKEVAQEASDFTERILCIFNDPNNANNPNNGLIKFRPKNSVGVQGTATLRRVPLWSPDGLNIESSLLIQSDMIQPPANYPVVDPNFIAQILTNNGSFINEGILTLKTVVNDNDLLKLLVLAADDEVKYRDLSSLPFGTGTIGGGGTHKRLPLWTPDGTTIKDSLLSQDNDIQPGSGGFSAQALTNDGSLQQTKELYLDTVTQNDTLTEVLVRDPSSANEVKFRNVGTIATAVGFDTLPMSTTADWNQTFLNAYISLDDTTVPYRSIQGMTTLTDGQTGVVIVENVKQTTLLADDVIRFPSGWGTPGNLYDNKISWAAGFDNGYPTSTLLYGESLKFKYHNYEIAGGGFTYKYVLYWESCCKLFSLNTCPVAHDSAFTANEDNAIANEFVNVVDDGYGQYPGIYTASALADPTAGTLVFNSSTGEFTFTPVANWYGSTTFTFTYNDGYCDSNTATVTLNILAVPEAPIWTSTDPVAANTYPNLAGGDTWIYNWTTADDDHPCSDLTYVVTVDANDGNGPIEIFPTNPGPSSPVGWLSFTGNNTCAGTLTGTYPAAGGNFTVIMVVSDPDPNAESHVPFTIGGLIVSKDTYFTFYNDTSGSMIDTIRATSQMSSVPEVKGRSNATGLGTTTLVMNSGGVPGRVNDSTGDTDDSFLCIVNGMEVSGSGIIPGTTVLLGGGSAPSSGTLTLTLSAIQNALATTVLTFTLTDAQKETDYNDTNNFRNLLQDYYATGQTFAQETAAGAAHNPVTNGQNDYDDHLYWYHSGNERPLGYLGFRAQGGATFATIGSSGHFPNASNIVVTAWGDESSGDPNTIGNGFTYRASPGEIVTNTWNDRVNSVNNNIGVDSISTRGFINALETAAGNNTIYRGIVFRVLSNITNDLEEIAGPGGFAQTGGLNANGYNPSYNPEASDQATPTAGAYNINQSLYDLSNVGGTGTGSPVRITYVGNVSNNPSNANYYYNLVKAQLNAIGYNL